MEQESNEKRNVYSDGSSSPNRLVHSGLNLNNTKTSGIGYFFIAKISIDGMLSAAKYIIDRMQSLSDVVDWRDLFILQAKHNDNHGIETVRSICEKLEKNKMLEAMIISNNHWSEISQYTDVADWLNKFGMVSSRVCDNK